MKFVKFLIIVFSGLNIWTSTSKAELISESIYRNIYEAFSGKDCEGGKANSSNCPPNSPTKINQNKLAAFSESQFFNRLATYEKERLECGRDYWKSIASGTNSSQNTDQLLTSINKLIPQLNNLRSKFNQLKLRNTQLQGSINFSIPREQLKALPTQKEKIDEYENNEKEMAEMKKIEELMLAQIPHSDIPTLRDMILDHAGPGFFSKEYELISKEKFTKAAKKIEDEFNKSIQKMASEKEGQNYNLDADTRERLATDDYLIGMMSRETPDLSPLIKKYNCQAEARKSGAKIVSTTANVASFAFSGGALALAKVGRVAYLAQFPKATAGIASSSRALSMGAMMMGGGLAVHSLADTCTSAGGAEISGACTQTPQTILKQTNYNQCIFEASLSIAGMKTPYLVGKIADQNSKLGQFIREMQNSGSLKQMTLAEKSKFLNLSGNLTDQDRITAASALFKSGGKLSKSQSESLIAAHRVASDKKYFEYSPAELKQKLKTLTDGGWTPQEADRILRSGLAGKMTTPEEVHKHYSEALQIAQQKGQVRSDTYRLYAESGAALNKDVSVAYEKAFELYQKERRIPTDVSGFKSRSMTMSERELQVFEDYAAKTGQTQNLANSITRRYQIVKDDIAKRFDVPQRSDVFENTLYAEINQLKKDIYSSNPQTKKRAEEMLKAFKTAFPGIR